MGGARGVSVVAVKEVASTVPKEDWSEDRLLPGDIIERVASMDGQGSASPFANGKAGLEDELRQIFRSSDHLSVWVKRGPHNSAMLELKACVIPEESVIPKKHYTMRYFHDFRHVVQLVDTTEEECLRWQESTRKILKVAIKRRLAHLRQQDNLLPYPWTQKTQAFLPVESSPMVFSILFMPFQPSPDRLVCKDAEDTAARAMAWFSSAQAAGVPMIFVSIQTELIFKESSKDVKAFFDAAGKESIQQLTSCGRFKMACSENTIIDVVRAVRLWYVPPAAEVAIDLQLESGDARFGLSLATNEEGFCYVVAVDDRSPADRAGVKALLEIASKANKLLVVSRVGEEKVVPWLVSCCGSIHCYGVTSIREQLSTLRESNRCARIHLMVWEATSEDTSIPPNLHEVCNTTKSESNLDMHLMCLSSTTPARPAVRAKSSTKRRSVSWSDDAGSQLATTSAF